MARAAGLSATTVGRVWRAFGLRPHRSETFKPSTDPEFVEKVRDIVGLYLAPPDRALVLCVDEKTGVQALDSLAADGPWRARARRVGQPLQPVPGEAPAPGRHGRAAHAEPPRDAEVGRARLRARQHDPDALGQRLAHPASAQQAPQFGPLGLGQFQRHSLRSTGHGAPPVGRSTVTPPKKNCKQTFNSAH